jgi:FkbM family methyltransferase
MTSRTPGQSKLSVFRKRLRGRVHHELGHIATRSGMLLATDPVRNWNGWLDSVSSASRSRLFSFVKPTYVLDVGANRGQYAGDIREMHRTIPIASYEPQLRCFDALKAAAAGDPNWRVIHAALGSEPGQLTLHNAGNELSSSLLPMTEAHEAAAPESKYVSTEVVDVRRLDDELAGLDVSPRDRVWLKIDTQGYEWPVILGAPNLLKQTVAIEMELSLVTMYEGQKLFPELVDEMKKLGFSLHGLLEVLVDPKSMHLLQVDGLFVSDNR